MKTPLEILQDTIIIPVHTFQKKYVSRSALHKVCKKTANYIFEHSKETALIMLGFNAFSVISSHVAQIQGLRKSNRENKDYLISQEKTELGTDILFTIIPPFLINKFLKKKLESGVLTTKDAKDKLVNVVAPVVGVSREELYNIDYIRPTKETLTSMASHSIEKLLKHDKNLPIGLAVRLRRWNNSLKSKLPNPVTSTISPNLEKITTDFDNLAQSKKISKEILSKLKNGSAHDELYKMNDGLLIIATLGYTIIASNIIGPIIKNKIANRRYNKYLEKIGETKESIKRKKRFANMDTVFSSETQNSIFNTFEKIGYANLEKQKVPKTEFKLNNNNGYNKIISQSAGLRI